MTKRMLIDAAHAEETRVVVVDGSRIEELDFEIASKRQLRGNIYLAKVTRVEPSLQAAFIEYGGKASWPSTKSTRTTTRSPSPTVKR
jgi:ribonuclease E